MKNTDYSSISVLILGAGLLTIQAVAGQNPLGRIGQAVDKAKKSVEDVGKPQSSPKPGTPSAKSPRSTVTNYLFCSALEAIAQGTRALYYSADFITVGEDLKPVNDEFLSFLQQKYSFQGDPAATQKVQCTGVHSVDESRSIEKGYIARDRQNKTLRVVETGWVFPGAVTQPPVSTSSAAQPSPVSTANLAPIKAAPSNAEAPAEQDPRLAALAPADRAFILNEMPQSKRICEQNTYISDLMDCSCFSRAVMEYRIAHVKDKVAVPNARQSRPPAPEPLTNVIGVGNLDCKACLPDDKITQWVAKQVSARSVGFSQAQLQKLSDCTGRNMLTAFRAQPFLYMVKSLYAQALTSCNK